MKSKLVRTLSLALCLVLLIGALPMSALAASRYSIGFYTNAYGAHGIANGDSFEIDLSSGKIYDGSTVVAALSGSYSSSYVYPTAISSIIEYFDDALYTCEVEFYGSSSYRNSDLLTGNIYSSDYSTIYARIYIYYNNVYDTYYDISFTFSSASSSTSSKYAISASMGKDFTFYESDFGISSKSYTLRDLYLSIDSAPTYGYLYNDNKTVSRGTEIRMDYVADGDLVYYCSSKENAGKKADSFTFSIYNNDTGKYIVSGQTMSISFSGSTSTSSKYSMDVTLGSNNYLDADDFYGSSSWNINYEILISQPKYGDIYDKTGSRIDYTDYYYLDDFENFYYYCSSSAAGSHTSDTASYTIYSGNTALLSTTFTFNFSSSSSSSTSEEKDFYLLVTASKNNYLDEDDFEDPGYYSYKLSKYTPSKVEFIVESIPSRGDLYEGSSRLSRNDTVTLNNIDDVYYYCSSDSSTDSMTFSLYDNSSNSYLVRNATLYFVFNADTAKDFTKSFTAGKSVSFTQSDFTSNFTAGSSGSSLKSIKITAIPSYGYLKLNSKTVSKGDVISYSDLGSLTYEPMDGSVTKDIFTYAATSSSYYSADATVTLSSAYTPTNYTVSTSGSVVTVTFTSATPTNGTIAQSLSAEDVTYLISKASSGSTLLIKIPQSVNTSGVTRSVSIDSSMFSTTGTSVYSRIILESTGYNSSGTTGNNVYLMVPTSSVTTLYNTYSGSFTMKEGSFSLTDDDKSAAGTTPGMARCVNMAIGANSVSPEGATLSVPFNEGNNSDANINAPVIMERLGYQSYQAVLSSTWSDTMPYLSTDDRPFVTCEVEGANKVYVAAINKQTYSDLATTHWGYSYIQFLSARGVMSGFAGAKAGQVGPDTSVTRAEFIKMLVVSLDLYDSSATTTYSDVNSNAAWAASYVGSAVSKGIVTDSGSFRPNDAITREEMALYAYRAANAAGVTLPTTTAATTFNDASSISSTEMSTAITAMQRAGIIAGEAKNGVATGNFDPQGVTTRAAAAKIISMLMELAY